MKNLKKWIAATVIASTLFSFTGAHSATYVGGCGYQQCRQAPALAPAIALGAIAIAAIVAVAVQNSKHGHCH